jgi:hypothetical protein
MILVLPTPSERVTALQAFGYTEREAAFLSTAALHGGYFLRRQYLSAIGTQSGGNAAALIDKLLTLKHASVAVGCNNSKLYHLYSRPFYATLGEEDNRNRRERPPFAIKNRLMGLDFVLGHSENTYLATEREKVDFFTGRLGIDRSQLPIKRFTSQQSKAITDRFFVDKYPIFITPGDDRKAPQASFCYVDEGVITGSRFGSYLRQYRALFLALAKFNLIYVSASDRLFQAAERDFRHFVAGLESTANGTEAEGQEVRMVEYFEARALYESQRLDSFDRARLIQLRNDRERFSGSRFEALYQTWKTGGEAAILPNSKAPQPNRISIPATFSTHLLKQDFQFFGSPPRASHGA